MTGSLRRKGRVNRNFSSRLHREGSGEDLARRWSSASQENSTGTLILDP